MRMIDRLLYGSFLWVAFFFMAANTADAGCVKGDCINGFGISTWDKGDRYEGYYKDGTFNGQGTYRWANGTIYKGQWVNSLHHGQGKYTWTGGKYYIGEFKANKRNGFGKYAWPDGAYYEGQWKDGHKHGQGIYVFSDGNKDAGLWENDKLIKPAKAADLESVLNIERKRLNPLFGADNQQLKTGRQPEPGKIAALAPAPAQAPSQPVSEAFKLAVSPLSMYDCRAEKNCRDIVLLTRGDHKSAGAYSIHIVSADPTSGHVKVKLTVNNSTICRLNFDAYFKCNDTYYRLISWHSDQAIKPGGYQTHSDEITLKSGFSLDKLFFRPQGWGENCQ